MEPAASLGTPQMIRTYACISQARLGCKAHGLAACPVQAKNVLVATGARAFVPPIEGAEHAIISRKLGIICRVSPFCAGEDPPGGNLHALSCAPTEGNPLVSITGRLCAQAKNILVATGARAFVPPIEGAEHAITHQTLILTTGYSRVLYRRRTSWWRRARARSCRRSRAPSTRSSATTSWTCQSCQARLRSSAAATSRWSLRASTTTLAQRSMCCSGRCCAPLAPGLRRTPLDGCRWLLVGMQPPLSMQPDQVIPAQHKSRLAAAIIHEKTCVTWKFGSEPLLEVHSI